MYLKSLELQGFKSFPDKTLIRFGDDITAIVGPNGSGKSNISDAILWVMGEQSSKTLRGAKMEDVIFGGTQKRTAVGFAEATLTLDNSDRALAYDADEVMVTRRYYRSGDSEYYINKQSARLRDINEMFMDTGLGREGYSNIGQGRIDEILSLKSGDRREIFEEAAGISKYRHRKEETERKLAATEDNLLRIGDKVSELELQLEPLKQQSEKAKKYLELKDELKGVEVAVWLDTLDRLSAAAKKAEEDYASASFVLQQAHDDLDALYRQADQLGEALRTRDGELETVRLKVNMLSATHQQLDGQMAVLRGNVENNNANISRIEEELKGQEDRSGGIVSQIDQTKARIEEIEAALAGKRRELDDLQHKLTAMTASAQGLTKQFLELRGKESSLAADVAGRQADVRGLEESMAQTKERLEQLNADLSAGAARQQEAQTNLDGCRRELKKAQEEVTAANNTIAGYTLRQNTRVKRRDELQEKIRDMTSRRDSVTAKARVFRAMERDFESYNKAVRMVMQEAQRGALRNIHGPVSRLIRTEDSYTVAIEIALGAAMQQIVVGTEQDGKAAIGYLKRTGGGRATFLPLSNIQGRSLQENGLENCRGFVGIASQLTASEETYRGIVENLLGRTVIADNLDHGIPIMRAGNHAFRLVTLEGDVMHSGGSMTGGSAQSKVSNLLSRERELKELTAKLQTGRAELDKCRQELTQRQQTAQEKRQKVSDAVNALHQQEIAVAREQARRESVFADLNTHLQRMQETEQARVQLHQSLEDIRQQLETIEHQRTGAQGDQSAMEQKTIEMQNALVKARAEASAENDRLMVRTLQLSDLRHGLSDLERDEAHAQQDQAQILREQERREQLLHEMDELDAIDENDMKREEAESARRQKEQLRQESAAQAIEQRRSQAQSDLRDILSDMENLHEAYNRDSEKLHKTELAKARIEGDQKNLQNRIWDTYKLTYAGAEEFRRTPFDEKESDRRAAELQGQIRALGTVNVGAVEEYAETKARVDDLTAQQQDLKRAEMDLRELIERLLIQMRSTFVENFSKMQGYFAETFTRLFGGGHAELKLMDPDDPLNCGIEVNAQPPGKKLQLLSLLSGGERALTAIAILFAMLKLKPTPFCILDEIEAALDDANIGYYADYLKEYSKGTQFIVVTHRKGTMERCNSLFGVAMEEQGVSRMVSVSLQDYQE